MPCRISKLASLELSLAARDPLSKKDSLMYANDIAARVHARRTATGWIARCPAHDDRRPSLAISEGRDGRILIRCHAGCPVEAIVSALGLYLHDLFSDARRESAIRPLRPDDVEVALREEVARIVERESLEAGFDVVELARHRNAAREVISRRYSVKLKLEHAPWFEIDPHAVDPIWLACVDGALSVAAARACMGIEELRAMIVCLPLTQHCVLRLARRFQRSSAPSAGQIAAVA